MATEVRYAIAEIRHDNHVPTTSLVRRSYNPPINTIFIVNTSTTANAQISFDGTNVLTLKPGAAFSMDFSKHYEIWTKGDGVLTLEVITGSEI